MGRFALPTWRGTFPCLGWRWWSIILWRVCISSSRRYHTQINILLESYGNQSCRYGCQQRSRRERIINSPKRLPPPSTVSISTITVNHSGVGLLREQTVRCKYFFYLFCTPAMIISQPNDEYDWYGTVLLLIHCVTKPIHQPQMIMVFSINPR